MASIVNETTLKNVSTYPNPAKNQLTISNNQSQILTIKIIDITGKTVKTINGNSTTVNVSDLTRGIYILKVATESGVATSRFVKQ